MRWFVVDVEAHYDTPCPGLNGKHMTEFAAVLVPEEFEEPSHAFWGRIPSENPKNLAVSGNTNMQIVIVESDLKTVMTELESWLGIFTKSPVFVSDNNGYDWAWINHGFWSTLGRNVFGHSSRNMGDLYKGTVGNVRKNFKHLRKTKHSHNPVDDAVGNVEALQEIRRRGLKGV